MTKALAEKIGVVFMFTLVLVVFSLAERDTKKIIQQHSKTAQEKILKTNLTASKEARSTSRLLTRN